LSRIKSLEVYFTCGYNLHMEIKGFRKNLIIILLLILTLITYGVVGYEIIEGWSLLDAIYMVVITLTTVGFREVHELSGAGMIFTVSLILLGTGVLFYGLSTVAGFVLEGDLPEIWRRRKMERKIKRLKNHFIVCGAGDTGKYVIAELIKAGEGFVVVDNNPQRVKELPDVIFVEGDATQDTVLKEAGIDKAQGLVATLPTDAENLFLVVTARSLNPNLRIITQCLHEETIPKMIKAGADKVVSPAMIGGLRIASELIRPAVVDFLDTMLREGGGRLRVEEVTIRKGSRYEGKSVGELKRFAEEKFSVLILAVNRKGRHIFNPPPEEKLEAEDRVIVMGEMDRCRLLEKEV